MRAGRRRPNAPGRATGWRSWEPWTCDLVQTEQHLLKGHTAGIDHLHVANPGKRNIASVASSGFFSCASAETAKQMQVRATTTPRSAGLSIRHSPDIGGVDLRGGGDWCSSLSQTYPPLSLGTLYHSSRLTRAIFSARPQEARVWCIPAHAWQCVKERSSRHRAISGFPEEQIDGTKVRSLR